MSDPTDVKDYADWTVVYDDQNGEKGDKLFDRRQTLARTLSIPKTMCIMSDSKTEISTVTELRSPKLQLPQLGDESAERVFPVRSVVSFDSTPSSALPTPSLEKLETPISPFSDTVVGDLGIEQPSSQPKRPSEEPNSDIHTSTTRDNLDPLSQGSLDGSKATRGSRAPFSTHNSPNDKFQAKTPTEVLSTHAGRGNELLLASLQASLQNGSEILGVQKMTKGIEHASEEEEVISVQPFGALLVITESDGNFVVHLASSNTKEIIGYSPEQLFASQSFCDFLPSSLRAKFIAHTEAVLDDHYNIEDLGPEIFSLPILSPDGAMQETWCTMHTSQLSKQYIICEIQPDSVTRNSGNPLDRLAFHKSEELDSTSGAYFENSNTSAAEDSSIVELELLNKIPRTLRRLANSQTLETFVQETISVLQEYVQFERTTLYHFDSDRNGIVLADATSTGLTSHEGLHFPASILSEASKRPYTRNTVCFSYSAPRDTAQLLYRASDRPPLDFQHTYLSVKQTPSSLHPENPVKACLSIKINVFGKLWGLLSCQSFESNNRLHPVNLHLCWFIAEAVSSNIERLSYSLPFQLKEPTQSNDTAGSQAIKTPLGDFLSLFGADYAAASILGETKILGRPTDSQEVLALFEYMKAKENDAVCWSTDITSDFPDLNYSRGFHHLAGLFYVPLSGDGKDFIIFFRARSAESQPEQGQLNFANETEKSKRQQLWSTAEIGKASILSQLYRTFTDVWQEKEVTLQNNQLMRLLLANSAHEFRTPLNAIINYLEIALDGSLDQETRDNISRSHSASRSLVYIINDLLDLTNAENGLRLIKDEVFNLSETLTEATDIFWEEARQKHVALQVVQHAALPPVLGDQRRVRQVITNLISNAVQHTSSGAVTVESCVVLESLNPDHISVEVAIHDTGSGMSQETVEALFCELEQVSNKGYMKNPKAYDQASSQPLATESVLGLGLALVARIVRNMNGQLSLKSEAGKGSCFKIRLEFPLPDEDSGQDQVVSPEGIKSSNERYKDEPSTCVNRKGDSFPCECGETPEFSLGEPGVHVDVNLKSGESRTLSLSANAVELEADNQDSQTLPSATSLERPHPSQPSQSSTTPPETKPNSKMNWSLHVLVAEDDPVNSTIVRKRLEKFGHTVHLTANGKECITVFKENPAAFDAVLMDLQMPIVDGASATRLIREYEQQELASETTPAPRIPIFAVSASLREEHRNSYLRTGFDGWIMKPIDFQRLDRLLGGVRHPWLRQEYVYVPGQWEEGGWFKG
ncbi:CheY-like superfamily [Penicillium brevicompactum]|uniref:histidine kinase n=1 Tax=Penicillium brevicompactum TaxID=5074 RepID=A0A9W9RKX9_PENBR|nr:CheY-like superfamily [Penicillium brevicompactum]